MAGENLYEDLREILKEFKDFLEANVGTIKPAVQALAAMIPEVKDLLDELIKLMGKVKTEVDRLDVDLGALDQAFEFTEKVAEFLQSAKKLLPDEGTIDSALDLTEKVTSLPSLGDVKQEIIEFIDAIIASLDELRTAIA